MSAPKRVQSTKAIWYTWKHGARAIWYTWKHGRRQFGTWKYRAWRQYDTWKYGGKAHHIRARGLEGVGVPDGGQRRAQGRLGGNEAITQRGKRVEVELCRGQRCQVAQGKQAEIEATIWDLRGGERQRQTFALQGCCRSAVSKRNTTLNKKIPTVIGRAWAWAYQEGQRQADTLDEFVGTKHADLEKHRHAGTLRLSWKRRGEEKSEEMEETIFRKDDHART